MSTTAYVEKKSNTHCIHSITTYLLQTFPSHIMAVRPAIYAVKELEDKMTLYNKQKILNHILDLHEQLKDGTLELRWNDELTEFIIESEHLAFDSKNKRLVVKNLPVSHFRDFVSE